MSGKKNKNGKTRITWYYVIAAVLSVCYVLIAVFLLLTPDVLPSSLVRSTVNYVMLGVFLALPLCMVVVIGIIFSRAPRVENTTITMDEHHTTLWLRMEVPTDSVRGEKRDKS